jgi:hypothetical protein
MAYDIGDSLRITVTFTGLDGAVADPTTVVLRLRAPDGTTTMPSVTKTSTGVYFADLTLTASGEWKYRWIGTGGDCTAADEGRISVRRSYF